jgi:DNA-binding transcriptional ArsR family regulator
MFGRKKDKEREEKKEKDLREQMRRLEEQMKDLRRRLEEEDKEFHQDIPPKHAKEPKPQREPRSFKVEFDDEVFREGMEDFGREMGAYGRELGDYIKMVVSDAMRGANRALRSVFIGPDGARIRVNENGVRVGKAAAEAAKPVDPEEAERLLSPLASGERIRILQLLAEEARYHQDLMELSGLKPGTLPHHLKQLEDAGYVTQERVRGRYLITIPGRMALKLAKYLSTQMDSGIGTETDESQERGKE